VTSNHQLRDCIECGTQRTRSASGLCFGCRPAPTVEISGDLCRIGGAFDLPTHKAVVLAHRILDALTPTMNSADVPMPSCD
jgi:hypothetical protein